MRAPTLAVRVQLPLGCNMYLLFNTDIVNFAAKTDEREVESIALLIFVLWWCLNRRWKRGGGVGQKSPLRPAEIPSFSSWDFSKSNMHDTLTCCINWIFLRFVFMKHCCFRLPSLVNLLKLSPPLVYYHFYSQQPRR